MNIKPLLFTLSLMSGLPAIAQNKIIRLYDGPAPGSERWTHREAESSQNLWNTRVVYNVVDPTLTVFQPAAGTANGAAVVICPGGGFQGLSIDSEGFDVAKWLATKGVTCFVLKYRLVESKTTDPTREIMAAGGNHEAKAKAVIPLAQADGLKAMSYVRRHAAEYGVDPKRIGIMGFSAGGTVTTSVALNYTPDSRPDFVAPIYLQYEWVPNKGNVPADAPPAFILAATDDQLGLAPHSVKLYTDWVAAKKSAELHLYSKGGHGFGMRTQHLPSDRWIALFADWLDVQGFMKREGSAVK
jgi:acetyl esterase/lipase